MRKNYHKNIDTILDFWKLEDNWNSNGAKKPDAYLIKSALHYHDLIQFSPDFIGLTANDSIQFEWNGKAGEYLEITVLGESHDATLHIYEEDADSKTLQDRDLWWYEPNALNSIVEYVIHRWYDESDARANAEMEFK